MMPACCMLLVQSKPTPQQRRYIVHDLCPQFEKYEKFDSGKKAVHDVELFII